jgi:hypothetical protein
VTAIGLTSAIYLASLLLSGLMYWFVPARTASGFGDARRTLLAMYRATDAGLFRSVRSTLGIICLSVAIWAVARLLITPATLGRHSVYTGGYALIAGLLGAAAATIVAHLAVRWAKSAALRTVTAALFDLNRLLITVLRSSLILALLIEVFGFVFCAGVFALCWALQPTALGAGDSNSTALHETIQILLNFSIGALLASFALQTSGTTYRLAAQVGTRVASLDANLAEIDPRNPSAIAETAGVQLGQLVPHVLDAFCSSLCANALIAVILWRIVGTERLSTEHTYLLIPVVMRAFGSLATVFGAGAARTLESLSPVSALIRSRAVFLVIAIGAICGSCIWLTPNISLQLSVCGILGVVFPFLLSHWQSWLVKRQIHTKKHSRQILDSPWNEGIFTGMAGVVVPLLLLVALLTGVSYVGTSIHLVNGRIIALMVCLLGMNIIVPFSVTLTSAFPLVVLARRAACLVESRRADDGQRRLARLEEAVRNAASSAASVQTHCGIGLPLLAAFAIGTLVKDSGSGIFGAEALSAVSLCVIAFVVPLSFGLQASTRANNAVVNEIHRQLGGFPKESGITRLPLEFTPSYRSCVDIAAREATKHLSFPTSVIVVPSLTLGLALCWLSKSPGQVGQALALYLGLVAISAFASGFVFEVAYDIARIVSARSARNSPLQCVASDNSAVHHLALHATPAVRILAKISVIAALTFVPYMF